MNKVTVQELTGLKDKHFSFVTQYLLDYDCQRAAEAAGYERETGFALLQREEIRHAIDCVKKQRAEQAIINAEWQLQELADNHMIARQRGDVNASNNALNLIGKHKLVDAFASNKLDMVVATDEQVVERIRKGRLRVEKAMKDVTPDPVEEPKELSFR